jgi:DNA polymerase-3 subunit delta
VLYILTGADDFSRNEALRRIKESSGEPTMLAANTVNLDGRQLVLAEFQAVCATVPFLAEKRLVIVTGMLERFESRAKGNARGKSSRAKKNDEITPWAECLTNLPPTTDLVLVEGKISAGNPLFKAVNAVAKVESFPLLNRPQLRQWLTTRVSERGGSISSGAVELLIRLVGSNLWVMSQELDKLLLFAPARPINEEDVNLMVAASQELSIFNVVDAVVELKSGEAERLLGRLLDRGATPAYLMVMLTRQFRLIIRLKELKRQQVSPAEMQRRLGLTNDFVFQKTSQQAARYSPDHLQEIYHRLLAADLSIKTGRLTGEMALNILVAELCRGPAGSG